MYADRSEYEVLNQACIFADGLQFSKTKYVTRGFWESLSEARRLQPGDIVINSTGTGTLGRVGFYAGTERPLTYDSHVTVVRVDQGRHVPRFLFYQMQMPAFQRQVDNFCTTGSTNQVELSRAALHDVVLEMPERAEQEVIADTLDSLDEVIRQTEALIAKHRRVRAGLVQDLLTRGLDAEGRLRDEATHAFRNSPLGRIPAEWEVTTLADVGRWMSGGTPSKGEPANWGGSIPWVSPKDMKVLHLTRTEDAITERGLSGTRLAPSGSVLIVVRGMILAHTFPVVLTSQPMAFNQDVKALVADKENSPAFLAIWFQARAHRLLSLTTTSTHGTKRLDMGELLGESIALPKPDEQRRIVAAFDQQDAQVAREAAHLAKLRRVKAGLMQDLLTGRVPVDALLAPAEAPTAGPVT